MTSAEKTLFNYGKSIKASETLHEIHHNCRAVIGMIEGGEVTLEQVKMLTDPTVFGLIYSTWLSIPACTTELSL